MWLSYSPLKYSTEIFNFRSVSADRTAKKRCDVGSGLNPTLCLIIIIIIFINFNWVITRWQWLCYMYTNMERKKEKKE